MLRYYCLIFFFLFSYVGEMGLVRVWTLLQYCLYGSSNGFSVVSNACLIKKD